MALDFDRGLTLWRLMIGITIQAFALLGAPDEARADCASGDGNIAAPGICTVPQVLTGSAGTIVSGAALTTTNTAAYTISGQNATVTNSGRVTGVGFPAFVANSTGGTLINNGVAFGNQATAIVINSRETLN